MSFMGSGIRGKRKQKENEEVQPRRDMRLANPVSIAIWAIIVVSVSAVAALMALRKVRSADPAEVFG